MNKKNLFNKLIEKNVSLNLEKTYHIALLTRKQEEFIEALSNDLANLFYKKMTIKEIKEHLCEKENN